MPKNLNAIFSGLNIDSCISDIDLSVSGICLDIKTASSNLDVFNKLYSFY